MTIQVFVRLAKKHKGVPHGQIVIDGKPAPSGAVPLTEFSEAVQALLQGQSGGASIDCEPTDDPTPATVAPVAGATAARPQQREFVPPPPPARPSGRSPGGGGRPNRGAPQRPAGAALADGPSPFDARNPYNFAEWDFDAGPGRAVQPDRATHDRWHAGRRSGILDVRVTARTPVFVPAGGDTAQRAPAGAFWSCPDRDGRDRFGLPGSSVKGVVRTLFEAWTNSRAGAISDADYDHPVSFRRRLTTAWVIVGDAPGGGLAVRKAKLEFVKRPRPGTGWLHLVERGQQGPWTKAPQAWDRELPQPADDADPDERGWQAIRFRANLYWVPPARHEHTRWDFLAVQIENENESAVIPAARVEAYLANLDSPAFVNHWARVLAAPERDCYDDVNHERMTSRSGSALPGTHFNRDDLARLDAGTVVFGELEPGTSEILCFGKNFNFLWPSEQRPRDLLGAFAPRPFPALDASEDDDFTDHGEATFGFAGPYREDRASHPFKGRVHPETFWAPPDTEPGDEVTLKVLLSPSGVKLKARPLYLPPRPDGGAATYAGHAPPGEAAAHFRGPKFHWHQNAGSTQADGLADEHRGSPGTQRPDEGAGPMADITIRPLGPGTTFDGRVHFENLTDEELGALLVSLSPGLYWGDQTTHGIKVGKGKPRGLGSLEPAITGIRLRPRAIEAFADLGSDPMPACADPTADIESFVNAFRTSVRDARDRDPARVQDLERLLRFPTAKSVRDYEEPLRYGWQPGLGSCWGDPKGRNATRPRAMRPAREIRVPSAR